MFIIYVKIQTLSVLDFCLCGVNDHLSGKKIISKGRNVDSEYHYIDHVMIKKI